MRYLTSRINKALSEAYRLMFRQSAYTKVFNISASDVVLADLASFAKMGKAPVVAGDPLMTGVLIGRQEMMNRIAKYANLSDEEVWRFISEGTVQQRGE